MRMEVHVHGTAFLCKGVHLTQVEDALRPWLDYLEIDALEKRVHAQQMLLDQLTAFMEKIRSKQKPRTSPSQPKASQP